MRRSLEASLDRLGLDRVDIALIHDPDDHGEQALREAYPALEQLRAEGIVRAIGVGMNQAAMLTRFVTDTDVDVVLVAGRYTLLDKTAARRPAAGGAAPRRVGHRRRSVQLGRARRPGRGRDLRLPARRPAELIERARRLAETCARFGVPLRAAAARFPLTHPAVASVLIGARSAAEISRRDRAARP